MATLTADESARARKIMAMLSASTEGERMNALSLLTKMADAKKLRVDELMLAVGGGSPQRPPSPGPKPPPYGNPWNPRPGQTNAREGGDYADSSYTDKSTSASDRAFAEMLRRQAQAKKAREDAIRAAAQQAEENAQRAKRDATSANLRNRLDTLQSIPESRLTPWEVEFRYSILEKALSGFWTPSDKQSAIINRILEKAL